jgi:site-specific recombinase XerD
MARIKRRLEMEGRIAAGLTLKVLKHTVASILEEMGYDDRTIADMLGQKTLAMAQHYSRRANRSRRMTSVVANFDAEVNRRRTEIGKPS